jgi:hypothetical protein
MKKLVFLAIFAGLSACEMPALNLNLPSFGGPKGETETVVTRDNVTLTGPRGFCIDQQSSNRGPASAFVVFGNCAAITGKSNAPQPEINAIVTSTVRPADPSLPKIRNSTAELGRYFSSTVGQIVLSRSNDPSSVEVIESGTNTRGAFFLYVNDASNGTPEGTENTYWRGYFDAKNSVVTVSVLSLDTNPLTRSEGLNILRQFSEAIQSVPSNSLDAAVEKTPESIGQDSSPTTVRPTQRPGGEPVTEPQKTRTGILGRLFG